MNYVFRTSEARRGRHLFVGLAAVLAMMGTAGCAGDEMLEDEPIDSVSQEVGDKGWNGIPPSVIAGKHLSTSNTDAAGVTTGGGDPVKLCSTYAFDPLANAWVCNLHQRWTQWLVFYGNSSHPITKDRHQLLKALVQCAMFPSDIVKIPGFPAEKGMFGLYQAWANNSLPLAERQLLSACIAAKVNAFGVQVRIAIVGPGPGADVDDPVLDPAFKYQEATFYGDAFGKSPMLMACSGKQISGVGTYVVGKNLRVCGDINANCEIAALGACGPAANRCVSGEAGSSADPNLGGGEYCPTVTDGIGGMFHHSLTVYLETAPKLIVGDVWRCGLKGDELCDDGPTN